MMGDPRRRAQSFKGAGIEGERKDADATSQAVTTRLASTVRRADDRDGQERAILTAGDASPPVTFSYPCSPTSTVHDVFIRERRESQSVGLEQDRAQAFGVSDSIRPTS
jgi:hypothetical protein